MTLRLVLVIFCCIHGFAISSVTGSAEGPIPVSPIEGPTSSVIHGQNGNSGYTEGPSPVYPIETPTPVAPQNGSIPSPFIASTPLAAPPLPYEGSVPSLQPVTPPKAPPHTVASPPTAGSQNLSAPPPILPPRRAPTGTPPIVSLAPVPTSTPTVNPPPPILAPRRAPTRTPPIVSLAPAPTSIPTVNSPPLPSPSVTGASSPPRMAPAVWKPIAPVASPSNLTAHLSPAVHPVAPEKSPPMIPDHSLPPAKSPSQQNKKPFAPPPTHVTKTLPPTNHSPSKARPADKATTNSSEAPSPLVLPPINHDMFHSPVSSPSASFIAPLPMPPAYVPSSPSPAQQGPTSIEWHNVPPPLPNSASHLPKKVSPSVAPSMSPKAAQILPKMPLLPPFHAFPPPPPNEDCSGTVCTEPYTNTPPGSPCGCVWPMQVGLRFTVDLYTFFPLVSELAQEIASGLFMKQSQVRIAGANAASEQPEKTVVLIDLVPLEKKFDNTTAFLTFQRFWNKKVPINASYFGDYQVLYVRYPGLPPSPPSPPSDADIIDGGPYAGGNSNGRVYKPIGVDVPKNTHKNGLNGGVIAIIVLSALVAVISCSAVISILVMKHRERNGETVTAPPPVIPSVAKSSAVPGSTLGSSSASLSFGSSMATYTGSAKTFSLSEIEKATENFDERKILGEGGFGLVYSGVLDDGTKVAVKVLKRDDHQGDREFLAEIEMLSRLHHRNLVKLIGICTEEHTRCLVYELIPSGSLESHLHGPDAETCPLDWATRMKIALGAARGLAYLHEDSSPRVIHRDFKASNILLEDDFTPKVSDFGLARTALDEESQHISTRVMGTFGYVAPEYAMTGHLLVKSDVYSYGVVLLELLTGRKPVDMSQPPGQENLVAWARPLLTSSEGLSLLIDPSLGPDVSFDSVAKVAAIASMCVQPEVSHRPFMGEVVQALKLVSAECDEARDVGSRNSSREDLSIDFDAGPSGGAGSGRFTDPNYDSGHDTRRGLSVFDMFDASGWYQRQGSGSFRRQSSSGPLRTGRFWQRMRRLSVGGASEDGIITRSC